MMNALLLEVKTYCYTMLQKIKRADSRDTWVGKRKIPGKYTLRKDRLATLNDYYDFAVMDGNQAVQDYISGSIESESSEYLDELKKMQEKVGKKS
tara:strand:- start:54 stop:338 length:285 start_codon:yes stop_codon:yes gene_type:complete